MLPIEPRPLPVETVQGLVPPLPGYPYFAHADDFPFQPNAAAHSAVNAWWLADASFLVYGTTDFIEEALARSPLPAQGFAVEWLGTRDENRGMILRNDTTLVVVFRGTRLHTRSLFDIAEVVVIDQDDVRTNRQFLSAVCRAGGHVHSGFLAAYASISDRLDAVVNRRLAHQTIWLTGHSLGGALATLAAAHLDSTPVQGLYTYGSPRVGDAAFVSVLLPHSHYRFVHRDDWVPLVPPEILGYVHGGTLQPVLGSGPRRFWDDVASGIDRLTAAVQSMTNQFRFQMAHLPFKISGLADHAPIYYATLLWNDLLNTQEPGLST
ncbi:MAG: lipase family protein [Pirellulaceae bacterium]